MLIYSIISLLLSNAVTSRRDKSILFSRIAMIGLIYSGYLGFAGLYFCFLDKGIGLLGGLFHATTCTQVFHVFLLILSVSILSLTGFYPRKV
jgi:NADH-ubiquinone oxidoreductase chain 2